MAQAFVKMFRIFCALGPAGPVIGGLLAPLIPLSPVNLIMYSAIFGIIYGIKDNMLNKKDGQRDLKISFRNSFFVYWPSMCLTYMCMLFSMCKASSYVNV
jgi:hypothetical protein